MRKFISAILTLSLLSITVSCVDDRLLEDDSPEDIPEAEGPVVGDESDEAVALTFAATLESVYSPQSKAVMYPGDEKSQLVWDESDEVSVIPIGRNSNHKFATSIDGSTTILKGSALTSNEGYVALYPYDQEATYTNNVITAAVPSEQTARKNSFSYNMAVAKYDNQGLSFKNVTSLIHLQLDIAGVSKIIFSGNNNENVAGKIAVSGLGSTPSYNVVEGAKSVTLVPDGATSFDKGNYYFAVLPQEFTKGYKLEYVMSEAVTLETVESESVTAERSNGITAEATFVSELQGSGTEQDPYLITLPEQLLGMSSTLSASEPKYYRLENDLDMSYLPTWSPVNLEKPYKVFHFDGNNKTISNFACSSARYASMFGVVIGSVKNLNFVNPVIDAYTPGGLLASTIGCQSVEADAVSGSDAIDYPRTLIQNITVTGMTLNLHSNVTNDYMSKGGSNRVGGLSGMSENADFVDINMDITIKDGNSDTNVPSQIGGLVGCDLGGSSVFTRCSVAGAVYGWMTLGGVLGYSSSEDGVTMTDCTSSATITSVSTGACNSGGVLGYAKPNCVLTRCSSSGNLVAKGTDFGGLVGYVESHLTLKECHSTSKVTGTTSSEVRAGGLVGTVNQGTETVIDGCYATGDVSIQGYYAGGLVGTFNLGIGDRFISEDDPGAVVKNSYATGNVSSTKGRHHGGLVGCVVYGNALTITNCYATGNVKGGQVYAGGLLGSANVTNRAGKGLSITKCYATGDVTLSVSGSSVAGGLIGNPDVGKSSNGCLIQDCYATGNVVATVAKSRFYGGLIGAVEDAKNVTISRCFASGNVDISSTTQDHSGVGGIISFAKKGANYTALCDAANNINMKIEYCIAWNKVVKNHKTFKSWTGGAIAGTVNKYVTLTDNYRRADMEFHDATGITLIDQPNVTPTSPFNFTQYHATNAPYACCYHGKAAPADATISSVASSLGWPTSTWDLSADVPKLK